MAGVTYGGIPSRAVEAGDHARILRAAETRVEEISGDIEVLQYQLESHRLRRLDLHGALTNLKVEGRPFAPALPTVNCLGARKTPDGGFIGTIGTLVLQRGQFNALWIRIGTADLPAPPTALLLAVVDIAIEAQKELKPIKGALYVAISEGLLERGETVAMAALRSRGFIYHHRRGAANEAGEAVYVCDLASMVPSYATSIEGATGVVRAEVPEKGHTVMRAGIYAGPPTPD